MGRIKNLINNIKIPAPVYFIATILLITYFMPRDSQTQYSYDKNRPWRYGLLTAPFDFQIMKSDAKLAAEKDSLLKTFQPYFKEDQSIEKKAKTHFSQDALAKSVPDIYIDYVLQQMGVVYKAGIISSEDYEQLIKDEKKQIRLRDDDSNVAVTRHISSLYTPKLAYEKILKDIPGFLDANELRAININEYLTANINFNENTTTKAKNELLQQIPLYDGMVQSGEKIIDRGEIVDSRTFDILNSYVKEAGGRLGTKTQWGWILVGQILCVSILVLSLMTYMRFFRKREYNSKKSVVFILIQVCLFCILTAVVVDYYKSVNLLFVIPFAIPVILVRTFLDARTAFMVHITIVLISAMMIPHLMMAEFIIIQLAIGMITIFSLNKLSERSQLVFTGITILITYMVVYSAWILCTEGAITQINPKLYIYFCINFILITFSYLLIYVCEKIFGYISEVTMIELSNINKPLLQRLSELAPGTFQHSMQVANLVSAAATRIGANSALVRTGALYHDIGKMENPEFFTENQSPGMNPHAGLSYKESARIIIAHVTNGVAIAKKHKLPQQIIDFIETHHGRGKAKYFYNSYKNEHPDEEVNEADFTYPGPNPFTRETALLMMADTVEAASRSLTEYTEESITSLVNKLIDMQVQDGLLKNAPITFHEIELAKQVFIDKLETIYHSRIAYPELKEPELKEDSEDVTT
ncbi:HD family phosphohydrolase [Dysgonomonas sp. 25]|uniref:HD family phosphohydrolase n=1 Tax=Dysgonomonas sp. 25 TaxID=2302933 RepID=UPI0013D068CD|nr:HDIG domain-containing metalloprotein [Dysgonomonas sp. 25]NDV69366.1 HDIG domain-containing protein [Dysgonomonas sp. 25]